MTHLEHDSDTLPPLDAPTHCLVRLAAVIGAGTERQVRTLLLEARALPPDWVEEVILQSYLFAGFPRTLNAAREWRRISGSAAPLADADADATRMASEWRARGEVTCAHVYGDMYDKLRVNITRLHPATPRLDLQGRSRRSHAGAKRLGNLPGTLLMYCLP